MRIHRGGWGRLPKEGTFWRMSQEREHIWGHLEEKQAGLRGAQNAKSLRLGACLVHLRRMPGSTTWNAVGDKTRKVYADPGYE